MQFAIIFNQVDQFAWELRHRRNRPEVVFVLLEGIHSGFKVDFVHSKTLTSTGRTEPSVHLSSNKQFFGYPKKPSTREVAFDYAFSSNVELQRQLMESTLANLPCTILLLIRSFSLFLGLAKVRESHAKFDVEAAYRHIPVYPSNRHLLGMKWCVTSVMLIWHRLLVFGSLHF